MKRIWALLALLCLACGPQAAVSTPTPRMDPGPATLVTAEGRVSIDGDRVEAESPHWTGTIGYRLQGDGLSRVEEALAGSFSEKTGDEPPYLERAGKRLDPGPALEALQALVPRLGASGPDQVWVGGTVRKVDLEGGFWQVEADQKVTLTEPFPKDLKDGESVIVTGQLSEQQVGISQAGPLYEVSGLTRWLP